MSSISEKFEKFSCDNRYYIPNLTIALENAIGANDIPTIITLAGEIERFKTLCGYTPAIQRFEESIKMYGHELNLLAQPAIKRALETVPRKTCSRCKCAESEQPQHQEGFANMVQCAFGNQNTPTREPEPETRSTEGLRGMLEAISRTEQTDNVTLIRAIDETQFPDFCNPMKCPPDYARHCSANRPENYGKRCVYKTLTTEQVKTHSETRQIDNDKLNNLLARLETLEKEVVNAENSPKNEHIFPNRPNLCKTKNPNGLDET